MIILDTYPVNNCMYFCIGTYNLFYCIPHVFSLISTYTAVYMWPKIGNLKMCLLCSTRAKLIYLRSDLFRFYTKQVHNSMNTFNTKNKILLWFYSYLFNQKMRSFSNLRMTMIIFLAFILLFILDLKISEMEQRNYESKPVREVKSLYY